MPSSRSHRVQRRRSHQQREISRQQGGETIEEGRDSLSRPIVGDEKCDDGSIVHGDDHDQNSNNNAPSDEDSSSSSVSSSSTGSIDNEFISSSQHTADDDDICSDRSFSASFSSSSVQEDENRHNKLHTTNDLLPTPPPVTTATSRISLYDSPRLRRRKSAGLSSLQNLPGNTQDGAMMNSSGQSRERIRRRRRRKVGYHDNMTYRRRWMMALHAIVTSDVVNAFGTVLVCTSFLVWIICVFVLDNHYSNTDINEASAFTPWRTRIMTSNRQFAASTTTGQTTNQNHHHRPLRLSTKKGSRSEIPPPQQQRQGSLLRTIWNDVRDVVQEYQLPNQHIQPQLPIIRNPKSDVEALTPGCEPAEWQLYHFRNCNDMHQLDFTDEWEQWKRHQHYLALSPQQSRSSSTHQYDGWGDSSHVDATVDVGTSSEPLSMKYLSDGLWRTVWAIPDVASSLLVNDTTTAPLSSASTSSHTPLFVVLKLMKLEHTIDKRNLDRHRREALTMERLTSHPNIVNIYGYCGTTLITEYIPITLRSVLVAPDDVPDNNNNSNYATNNEKETMDHRPSIRSSKYSKLKKLGTIATRQTPLGRLQLALQAAKGVQALHSMPDGAIVHADLQDQQFLVTPSGQVKLNDFNRCRFVSHRVSNNDINNNTTTTPCTFRIPSAPGTSRSPEEYAYEALTEQIDMYSLANVLHQILSGSYPWEGWSVLEIANQVQKGIKPMVEPYILQRSPSDRFLQNLTLRAYELDPNRRLRATALVEELQRYMDDARTT